MPKRNASEKVTARDVARRSGASTSAVSRAFRPGASIAEDTRARILVAAGELGYTTPSGHAVSQAESETISLVAGNLANPFYPTVLEALSRNVAAQGRKLVLHVVPGEGSIDSVMQQVFDYRPDAVIVTSTTLSSRFARTCMQRNLPVVLFNRTQPDTGASSVCCDNYSGGRAIARRLVESAGRRRIAFVAGREDTSTNRDRWRGFSETLDELAVKPVRIASGNFEYGKAFECVRDMLSGGEAPDGIFCANDIMALAAIDAAKAVGAHVPDDVAIIGFDDIPMAAWESYQLTTVRQRIGIMIRETLGLIDQILEDSDFSGSIRIVPCSIVERKTG